MEGHPNETTSSFCGRETVEKFSYCPLHLMIVFQPKGKKEDLTAHRFSEKLPYPGQVDLVCQKHTAI